MSSWSESARRSGAVAPYQLQPGSRREFLFSFLVVIFGFHLAVIDFLIRTADSLMPSHFFSWRILYAASRYW
jgi:hypothetical protein